MTSLKDEYNYFQTNLPELFKKYPNKFIVIKRQKILGVYKSFDDAFDKTRIREELGTFIIQECVLNEKPKVFFSRFIMS